MLKKEVLRRWECLPRNLPLQMEAIPYKHRGTAFAEDGIRITGSQQFIDSVLSRLKDLLKYEDDLTRLQLVYKESLDKESGAILPGSWNCYIQVHERGQEAQIMNAVARKATGRASQPGRLRGQR
jgi:hypothetical protein